MSLYKEVSIVELDYFDLVAGKDLSQDIARAYGSAGTGVLTVKNVPDFVAARDALLPLSQKFATLPEEIKQKYVHAESSYSFGWSHGKENLQGKPDVSKGSYYANPQYDRPVDDEKVIAEHAPFVHPNIWPTADLPALEGAFKTLGNIIVDVGKLVARQCDSYVSSQCATYPRHSLENTIETSRCCKARLLHYFPIDAPVEQEQQEEDPMSAFSSWCGWHNDHGSLTGLTSAMYMDADGRAVQNADPKAGLFIRSRQSELIKVSIPPANIAFQIGETAQVHSGGLLQATPHAVRGSNAPHVSRESFAVFMEPMWTEPMSCPAGLDASNAQSQSAAANLPPGVPPLSSRWHYRGEGAVAQTFGEFSDETLKSYY